MDLRATSSLPVPFSPVISTQPLVGAATRICSFSFWIDRRLAEDLVRAHRLGAQPPVLALEARALERVADA